MRIQRISVAVSLAQDTRIHSRIDTGYGASARPIKPRRRDGCGPGAELPGGAAQCRSEPVGRRSSSTATGAGSSDS